ncbi:MAG: inositol monophosphatase [Hungatella sp.]|jgi:myo-inositol-1(or 4)-monophosphatase|nr:inositol monophosphatase [Hungatella sp.]
MLKEQERQQVIKAVAETKPLILDEMKRSKVTVKGAADYVTNVDLAVQEHLKRRLAELFPRIGMIAEEKGGDLERTPDGTYWILDPIDGTTNLIHHYGLSAVALALYEKGEITLGVVYNPFYDELFYGAKGCGAYLNGEPIHVSSVPELKDAVISYGSAPYEKEYADELFPLFCRIFKGCADFRRSGSAELDMCYVACGRVEGYLERNLKPWDYSAGSLILEEAGGCVCGWKGERLSYLTNADVLCCAGQFKDELLGMIKG